MPKRPQRKVVVRLVPRSETDRVQIIEDLAKIFPTGMEIEVSSPQKRISHEARVDEHLEAKATEKAARILDKRDAEIKQKSAENSSTPLAVAFEAEKMVKSASRLATFVQKHFATGYKLYAVVKPLIEKLHF